MKNSNTKHQNPNTKTSNRGWSAGVRMTSGVRVKSARRWRPEPRGSDARIWAAARGERRSVVGGSLAALEEKLRGIVVES